ncbi:MAG: hypothetical protein WAU47_05720 [Desulfobaccales bacterium]
MNKRGRKKIYKRIVQSTTGIWVKGDGLACQEKLRAKWDKRLQGYYLLKATDDEDNL